MLQKFIIALVLLIPAFTLSSTATAATTTVKVYCPCEYHKPLVLAPARHVLPVTAARPVTTTYVNPAPTPYVRQPDPNDIAIAHYRRHPYGNSPEGCNYYGYDCVNPTANQYYSYARQPDPNEIANAYYSSQPSEYYPFYQPHFYYGY